jgi:hypothetical protein
MATLPLRKAPRPIEKSEEDKLRDEAINKIPDNNPTKLQEELEDDKSKKSNEWQNWCLRIKKSTLNEIDEIIQSEEWAGYKKTTWILQAIRKELNNEKAKINGKQE